MSGPVWMPLYVGDYLKDTGHLSTIEHGAYLLLILHYWQHGGLPTDDRELAKIARVRTEKWRQLENQLKPLFLPNWRHRRIDKELEKARAIIMKRKISGIAGAAARYKKLMPNAMASAIPFAMANGMANACTITSSSTESLVDVSARAEKEALENGSKPPAKAASGNGTSNEITPQLAKSRLAQKSYDR